MIAQQISKSPHCLLNHKSSFMDYNHNQIKKPFKKKKKQQPQNTLYKVC